MNKQTLIRFLVYILLSVFYTSISNPIFGQEPTVDAAPADTPTVQSVGYYSDWQLTEPLSGTVAPGTTFFVKIVFSEAMQHKAADDNTARPILYYRLGRQQSVRFRIAQHGASGEDFVSGDAKPFGSGTDDYICKYTSPADATESFRIEIGKFNADTEGNNLPEYYTHTEQLQFGQPTDPESETPVEPTPAATEVPTDTTPPTVVSITHYYHDGVPIAEGGTVPPGTTVDTKIVFSEPVTPAITYTTGDKTGTYNISQSGVHWRGLCKPTDESRRTWLCKQDARKPSFTVTVTTNTVDLAGNMLAEVVTAAPLEVIPLTVVEQIITKYDHIFQREDIRQVLPEALEGLKTAYVQERINPETIARVIDDPDLLRTLVPTLDPAYITHLKEALPKNNAELKGLLTDPQVQVVLQDARAITEFQKLRQGDLGTPGNPKDMIVGDETHSVEILFSELMFATNGGLFSQPQWIELYNNTPRAEKPVNLKGWKLVIKVRDAGVNPRRSAIELVEHHVAPNSTVLLVTRNSRHSKQIAADQIYNLYQHHGNVRNLGLHQNTVLGQQGFALELFSPDGILVDTAGNLQETWRDPLKWELPSGRTEDGARTSLVRQYKNGKALDGTQETSWVRAADLSLPKKTYYGHKTDIGTPGFLRGGVNPVELSHFRASRTDTSVLLEWITASELDNAGFNILRGQTKDGSFVKVNPTLIPGAGTTAERQTYTWTDTTAKPNVAYYYRIEDVSFSGNRQRLATVRMRGYVSASDKLTTTWSELKIQE